jgi:hypothetical protein
MGSSALFNTPLSSTRPSQAAPPIFTMRQLMEMGDDSGPWNPADRLQSVVVRSASWQSVAHV